MDSVPAGTHGAEGSRVAEVARVVGVTGVVEVDEGRIRSVAAATREARWSRR